jgi:hypothetical protein
MENITSEYEEIRSGLIALLCVGDQLNYIHSEKGAGNYEAATHDSPCVISRCVVVDLLDMEDGKVIKLKNYGHLRVELIGTIEQYQGELYVWSNCRYNSWSRETKIRKMIEVIESKYTMKTGYGRI